MMRYQYLTESQRGEIHAAVARAESNPVPWMVVRQMAADRRPNHPSSERVELNGHLLFITFERQPIGLCEHISLFAMDGREPPEPLMAEVARACGMTWPPDEHSQMWPEEFAIDGFTGRAINLIEVKEVAH